MRKLICKIFGCQWKYLFNNSNSYHERTDIRICKCCGKVQHYMKIPNIYIPSIPKTEMVWMNMIEYTKLGAEQYWRAQNLLES